MNISGGGSVTKKNGISLLTHDPLCRNPKLQAADRKLICAETNIPTMRPAPKGLDYSSRSSFTTAVTAWKAEYQRTMNEWYSRVAKYLALNNARWAASWVKGSTLNGTAPIGSSPVQGRDIAKFGSWAQNNRGFVSRPWGQKSHLGQDFNAYNDADGQLISSLPDKTPVRAILPGIVTEVQLDLAEPNDYYSSLIIIAHGQDLGRRSEMHLSGYVHVEPLVIPGQIVEQNEPIGLINEAGYNSGFEAHWSKNPAECPPHLHFELTTLHLQGGNIYKHAEAQVTYYDPAPYLLAG